METENDNEQKTYQERIGSKVLVGGWTGGRERYKNLRTNAQSIDGKS